MEVEQSASEREAAGADAQASANGRTPKDGKASPISLNSKARLTTMSAALAGQTSPSSQLFAAYSNRASYISDTRAVPGPSASESTHARIAHSGNPTAALSTCTPIYATESAAASISHRP